MSALDFWLGDWDAIWEGGAGINRVTRELGGKVIVERFEAGPPEPFEGLSVSVPDPTGSGWRQTWVDSNGSYWAFVGGPQNDGSFVFGTSERVDADQLFKRMVFHTITAHSFRWRWESSADGARWDEKWAISYQRQSSGGGAA